MHEADFGDERDERGADRGVHGVAAGGQDLDTPFGRLARACSHDSLTHGMSSGRLISVTSLGRETQTSVPSSIRGGPCTTRSQPGRRGRCRSK